MGIGYPTYNNQHRTEEENGLLQEEHALLQRVESTHRREEFGSKEFGSEEFGRDEFESNEFFDVLSPMLQEAGEPQGHESPHQESRELLLLLEENARLRKLAVEISNLLGDLPEGGVREIEPEVVERLSVIGDQLKAS